MDGGTPIVVDRTDSVGTPVVVDRMDSVVFSSCSCLEMEPDDFSFFWSFAAVVINTIPTIKKIKATANTTSVMILSFECLLLKVVSGPSDIIISVLLADSMIGKTGSQSASVLCLARSVLGQSLVSL